MFRRLGPVWVIVGTILAGGSARAQMPFPNDLVPARTTLERLGLERQWFGVIPLVETERLLRISLAEGMLFAQTSYARLHAFDAESGRLLWSAQLGERSGFARAWRPIPSRFSLPTRISSMRSTRRRAVPIWKYDLGTIPTSTPAAMKIGSSSG